MKKILVLACLGTAVAVVGCGDDDDRGDPCEGVAETDLCETAGDVQCSSDGTRVQTCAADANGCLVWTSTTTCGTNQTCVATGDTPACECTNECTAGESECRGSVVWACEADADGCPAWAEGDDCADTGESCVETGTTAECSSTCTPDCTTAGDTQCSGTVIQTCTDVGGGCLQWEDGTDCADTSEVCDDTAEPAVCTAVCTPTCTSEGETQCSGTVIQTCTDVDGCLLWQDGEDCADRGEVCDDSAEPAVCAASCTPDCTTAGDTQCDGTVIETCTDVGSGCLQWVAGTDCATTADYCDMVGGAATCLTCTDACTTPGETQCNGTVIETCAADAHGCLAWAPGTDCAATGQECDDTAEPATCVEPRGTGSCADPIVVRVDHYALAGSDFTTDFTNDQTFTDSSCDSRPGTVEAVFSIDLAAGETVRLRELGALDAVLSLQNTCGDTSACVFAEDYGEVTGYDYTAATDETVYLIVEAYYAAPSSRGYDIRIDIVSAEDCGNSIDDDVDGDVDCDDSDCFGDATHCATETNCADGEDNDADGNTDCDDSDCGTAPACAPYRAVFEAFAPPADPFDLEGKVLTFTPSATDPMGYTWAVTDGTGAYLVTPGSGTTTATLTLTDDSNAPHAFTTLAAGFPFYGTTYHRLFVGSNGYVTFASGSNTIVDTQTEFFAQPIVAALAEDLNPAATGAGPVTVDEFADHVAVTFHNVPFYGETALNQFQIVLHSDGRIQLAYVAVPAAGFDPGDAPYVGIASGSGRAPYPAETNFYVAPVAAPGDVVITEILYDPNAVTDANGEWFEIYNPTTTLLNLEGVVFTDLNPTPDRFTVTGRLLIRPGQHLVLGRNGTTTTNGGVTVDYVYPGSNFNLANTDDEIIITAGSVEIDRVAWNEAGTPPWPAAVGASIQLNPLRYAEDNNDPANWCLAAVTYGAGDRGTPGAANPPCASAIYLWADLETDPGWTICGGGTPCDWQRGTPAYTGGPAACAGGTGCFGTNLTGTYAASSDFSNNYVQAGPIDLSSATAAMLQFDMWLDTEAGLDFARVEVSTDGTTFTPLTTVTPAYTHPTGSPTQWGTDFLTWTRVTADLAAYTGAGMSTVYLRWAFDSDSSVHYAGFYFDNVLVYAP